MAQYKNSSEGYVGGGSAEDYDQAELIESSYSTGASQGVGAAGSGNAGADGTSGSGRGSWGGRLHIAHLYY